MQRIFGDCWFLTGPTASGKNVVGLEVAERLGAEVLAMDSMTLYREMDIGTAKPTTPDRARVPHHLLDLLDPSESASVDWYLQQAEQACQQVQDRGRRPLFVGGTPLYLKACLRGLFEGPPADPHLRTTLEAEARAHGIESLHRRLRMVDPLSSNRIHPSDLRRIVRALEVFEKTGRPISDFQQQFDQPADPAPPVACLAWPTKELYHRIDQRVPLMLQAGWIDEVQRLLDRPVPPGREAFAAVGYQEIAEHLRGKSEYDDMVKSIQTRTRQFSKRQRTWFRHISECWFLETSSSEPTQSVVDRLVEFFERC